MNTMRLLDSATLPIPDLMTDDDLAVVTFPSPLTTRVAPITFMAAEDQDIDIDFDLDIDDDDDEEEEEDEDEDEDEEEDDDDDEDAFEAADDDED